MNQIGRNLTDAVDGILSALHTAWTLRTDMNAKTRMKRRSLPGHGGASRVAAQRDQEQTGETLTSRTFCLFMRRQWRVRRQLVR